MAYAIPSGDALAATPIAKGYLFDGDRNPRTAFQHAVVRITPQIIDYDCILVLQTVPSLVITTYSAIPCFGCSVPSFFNDDYYDQNAMALLVAEGDA